MKITIETFNTKTTIEEDAISLNEVLDVVARALMAVGYSPESIREVIEEL